MCAFHGYIGFEGDPRGYAAHLVGQSYLYDVLPTSAAGWLGFAEGGCESSACTAASSGGGCGWVQLVRAHNLEQSMSRRGNCHDNAVAERFFSLLKRERIRRRTNKTREEARQDVFDYVEMFYNPVRKHVRNRMQSPVEFERLRTLKAEGV